MRLSTKLQETQTNIMEPMSLGAASSNIEAGVYVDSKVNVRNAKI